VAGGRRPPGLAGPAAAAGRADGELSIEPGSTPREIAQAWVDAGVQTDARLLYEWFRWSGQARRIRAGSYEIDPAPRRAACWTSWCRATRRWSTVRFIEGWTCASCARAGQARRT
jgi:UPF0755 protein